MESQPQNRMIRWLLKISLCSVAIGSWNTLHAQPLDTTVTLRHDKIERRYKLHLPDGLRSGAPLVVVLHGYGGSADPDHYPMNATADRHGFAVCYPEGAKDSRGKRCWNVGYPFQQGLKTDDIGFLRRVVRELQRHYALSRDHVFCTGMSNGGEMCYQLAAQSPETFAAVAPVSGLMMTWLYRSDHSTTAVPLLEIHGTKDKVSVWEGDQQNKGGWGAYMPVELAIQFCAAKNRCTDVTVEQLPPNEKGFRIVKYKYTGGIESKEVWLYKVIDGTHTWNGQGYDTGELLWEFFSRYID